MGEKMSVEYFNLYRDQILEICDKTMLDVAMFTLLMAVGSINIYLGFSISPFSIGNYFLLMVALICAIVGVFVWAELERSISHMSVAVSAFFPRG